MNYGIGLSILDDSLSLNKGSVSMIKLFWYNNNNFGDEISPYIVEKLSGDKVCFRQTLSLRHLLINSAKSINQCIKGNFSIAKKLMAFSFKPVLIAVGSLLESSTPKSICWGTGMAQRAIKPTGGRFIITRGFLSKKVLEEYGYHVESTIAGDPAILMPLLFNPAVNVQQRCVGIIPHVSEYRSICQLLDGVNSIKVVDFRTADVEKTICLLKSFSVVYSSSLHGLILCHAYGIPCIWFQNNSLPGGNFKFYDYFSAVHIKPYTPLTITEVREGKRLVKSMENVSKDVILEIQRELLERAPFKINKPWTI